MFLSRDSVALRCRSNYINLKRYFNENTYVFFKTVKCENIQDKNSCSKKIDPTSW